MSLIEAFIVAKITSKIAILSKFSAVDEITASVIGQLISPNKPIHRILGELVNKPHNFSPKTSSIHIFNSIVVCCQDEFGREVLLPRIWII